MREIHTGGLDNFTFHNVSISTCQKPCAAVNQQTLHSTMYLFLRQGQKGLLRHAASFTFHNVSISTSCAQIIRPTERNLYIPQCIYFYITATGIELNGSFTLHSTMYLFLPRPIFSLSNTVITSPVLSTSFLISILSQIYTCDNIHFTYHAL